MTDAPPPPPTPDSGAVSAPASGTLSLDKTRLTSAQMFAPVVPPSPPDILTLPVGFTGEAGEYFRIWIVNVLLSVVTLGIYTPWARVRTRQYFYGHTWLDGHNFEYTARPLALLRGFLLVGALFVVYTVSQQVPRYGWISAVLLLLFGALYPWLVYRSLKFNAANTVYRGLNFHFHGTAGGAYVAYLLILLSVPFTAGLTYPLAVWMQRRYLLQHAAYGTARTAWGKDVGPVYIIFLTAAGVSLGLGVVALLVVGLAALIAGQGGGLNDLLGTLKDSLNTGASSKRHGPQGSGAVLVGLAVGAGLLYALFILASLALGQYVRAALLKYSLHDLYVGQTLRLQATFNPVRLAWIGTSNLVAQVFTLGLLTPWAAVRRTRYLLGGVQVQTIAGLADFAGDATPGESALGEAAHEFFNFDLGF
ncbi:YjgN family protein [Deinococcus radiomollis]|uniref:YjgN family protein n=1 Tax=Deinococcus radiomollis TaxID=468916 RepID=UPI00389171E7